MTNFYVKIIFWVDKWTSSSSLQFPLFSFSNFLFCVPLPFLLTSDGTQLDGSLAAVVVAQLVPVPDPVVAVADQRRRSLGPVVVVVVAPAAGVEVEDPVVVVTVAVVAVERLAVAVAVAVGNS
jgi:hypothetical protein